MTQQEHDRNEALIAYVNILMTIKLGAFQTVKLFGTTKLTLN